MIAPKSSVPDLLSKPATSVPAPAHLKYLDGLRGLAALYVVLFHCTQPVSGDWARFPFVVRILGQTLMYGHFAVAIFIVLSGYCLMLPVARSAEGQIRGGFDRYIRRRAKRILPPYYAALCFALLLILLRFGLKRLTHHPDPYLLAQNFAVAPLVSHLLLVHNFSPATVFAISSAFWSVAVEWQIYLLFPLVLLPLWRRGGLLLLLLVTGAVSMIPHFAAQGFLDSTCPWYVALFSAGMAGAVINFAAQAAPQRLRNAPWPFYTGLLALLTLAALASPRTSEMPSWWTGDFLVGGTTACLLIACTNALLSP